MREEGGRGEREREREGDREREGEGEGEGEGEHIGWVGRWVESRRSYQLMNVYMEFLKKLE
jgi:hypothetical protein